MSMSMVSMAVFSLIYGSMADRHGRRPVLLVGLGVAVLGSLVCANAPTIEWAIVGRALQAAGATSGLILTRVIVHDIYGDKRTASVLGYIVAAMTLAPLIGPMLGGILIEEYNWRFIFYGVATMAFLLWVTILVSLPETRAEGLVHREPLIPLADYKALLIRPDARNYMVYFALAQSTLIAFLGGIPYLVAVYYDLPATLYALFVAPVAIGYAVGGLLAGKFSDRIPHLDLVSACSWASSIAVLLSITLLVLDVDSIWTVCLPSSVVAMAIGFASPAAQAQILKAAGRHSGSASGFSSFFQLVVSAGIAQFVGWSVIYGPYGVLLPMFVCSVTAAMLIQFTGSKPVQPVVV
jgi:DHA1 family bicyclomycin/chloramphenicol resistance-like MFS transporter